MADGLFVRSGLFYVLPQVSLKPLEHCGQVMRNPFSLEKMQFNKPDEKEGFRPDLDCQARCRHALVHENAASGRSSGAHARPPEKAIAYAIGPKPSGRMPYMGGESGQSLVYVQRDLEGTYDMTDPRGIIRSRKKAAAEAAKEKKEIPTVEDVIPDL